MPRLRLVDLLFDICLTKWQLEGWRIKKNLRPPASNTCLATIDEEELVVEMFPHEPKKHPPLEQTLLHELLHIGLDLDGLWDRRLLNDLWNEDAKKGTTYWLERYLWRRLTQQQKDILTHLLEGEDQG